MRRAPDPIYREKIRQKYPELTSHDISRMASTLPEFDVKYIPFLDRVYEWRFKKDIPYAEITRLFWYWVRYVAWHESIKVMDILKPEYDDFYTLFGVLEAWYKKGNHSWTVSNTALDRYPETKIFYQDEETYYIDLKTMEAAIFYGTQQRRIAKDKVWPICNHNREANLFNDYVASGWRMFIAQNKVSKYKASIILVNEKDSGQAKRFQIWDFKNDKIHSAFDPKMEKFIFDKMHDFYGDFLVKFYPETISELLIQMVKNSDYCWAVKKFLDAKASVKYVNQGGDNVLTSLATAIYDTGDWGTIDITNAEVLSLAKLLIRKSNINHQNKDGETPLLICVKKDNFEAVKLFLEYGADPNIKSLYGSPLEFADSKRVHSKLKEYGAK